MKIQILVVTFFALSCGMSHDSDESSKLTRALHGDRTIEEVEALVDDSDRSELVYEESKTKNPDDRDFVTNRTGALSADQVQRTARPYRNLGPNEKWVYDETAWGSSDAKGMETKGYRVTRRRNDNPYLKLPDLKPAFIHPELIEQMQEGGNPNISVLIGIRDFPDWDIPVVPRAGFTSVADFARLSDERLAKIEARKKILENKSIAIRKYLSSNGGWVSNSAWRIGYIFAKLSQDSILGLLGIPEVTVVEPDHFPDSTDGTEFYVGNQGIDSRSDVDDYFNEGYEGGQPNISRHGYSDMFAAVTESFFFEDEACSFQDGANNCGNHNTDRIIGRWDCRPTITWVGGLIRCLNIAKPSLTFPQA